MGGVYIKDLKLPKDELAIFKDGKYIEWNRGLDFKEYEVIDIVTCEECVHCIKGEGMPFCDIWLREVEADIFCSYGERRNKI